MPKKSESSDEQPSFESSVDELEQIVRDLEEGHLGLQESLGRFETGVKLLKTCYRTLEDAEKRIEVLAGWSEDGSPDLEDFDASATADESDKKAGRRKSAGRKKASKKKAEPEESSNEDNQLFS
ncbi:exodeoxyribonuclease VII small subunit [Stratiformator vulcanicus]|uniref:Exodeoxyribonuclease 7 small subunit n=1 Tax=Stratiformator vulcanicus TaxID=2527980 RepID=A0A517R3V6_9PLAN|nr:exodeoxyribonuclease VII small subunit [Stratiformator vulcanicus]QDT38572.1 Exodeoxyribonuclease 7 small subunit [Stratiformator vulcanicus]